jgi:hypothetical protein
MIETTTTDVTVPAFKPALPVPEGGNVLVQVPVGGHLFGKPDMTVDIAYSEKVTGGNQVLPNPALSAAKALGTMLGGTVGGACPDMCCTGELQEVELCTEQPFKWETVQPKMGCPKGCPNRNGVCVCESGKPSCPSHKPLICNLNGTDYCVKKDWGCSAWGTRCSKEKQWNSC